MTKIIKLFHAGHPLPYAVGTILLWSTVASAFKLTLTRAAWDETLLLSSGWATGFLWIHHLSRNLLKPRFPRPFPGVREILHSAFLGFLNPFLYYSVLFMAYGLLPAREAIPLNYTWPIVLSLLAVPILGQRISSREVGSMVLSLAGVAIIATRGDLASIRIAEPLGAALALGSSLIWAFYWLLSTRRSGDESTCLTFNFSFGFAYGLLFFFISGRSVTLDPWAVTGCAYIGFAEMAGAFLLWQRAMKLACSTAGIANLIFITPFLSMALSSRILGESFSGSSTVGLILIVTGIILGRIAWSNGSPCGNVEGNMI